MTPTVRMRARGAAAPSVGRRHVGKGSGVRADRNFLISRELEA